MDGYVSGKNFQAAGIFSNFGVASNIADWFFPLDHKDTNGLAFHALPLMLGVSVNRGFIMNSLAVPRKAKQAIGGIATLKNADGKER